MNRSAFQTIKYMNVSIFSKPRYINGVGFKILARTPVPQLPLSLTDSRLQIQFCFQPDIFLTSAQKMLRLLTTYLCMLWVISTCFNREI